jgi:catechol 2,3-dioxygenase-like lactoylglutathione lyase family enzyme
MVDEPSLIFRTVNFDCDDAQAMARFYGGLLGWEPTVVEPNWVLIRDPHGATGLSFQETEGYERPVWPEEPGRQQKMLHLEIQVTPAGAEPGRYSEEAGQAALEAALARALLFGGTLAQHQFRPDLRVVLDPSGHPLCLFLY